MAVETLHYARAPARRRTRLWVLVALALLVALATWKYGEQAWRRVGLAYHGRQVPRLFDQCVALELPRDRPLYADQGDTPQLKAQQIRWFEYSRPSSAPVDPVAAPLVAPPPAPLVRLFHHVERAEHFGPKRDGNFHGWPNAARQPRVTMRDGAVLYAGALTGNRPDPWGQIMMQIVSVRPRELRLDYAGGRVVVPGKPDHYAIRYDPEYESPDLRLRIERQRPTDRLEWFAARLHPPDTLIVPYRLNNQPGEFTIRFQVRGNTDVRTTVEPTHGWINSGVWYTGGKTIALLPLIANRRAVQLDETKAILGTTFDSDGKLLAAARPHDDFTRLLIWQINPDSGTKTLQATVRLPDRAPHHPELAAAGFMFSADGQRLVYPVENVAHVYDAATGAPVATCPMPPSAFGRRPRDARRKLALSADGRVLATLSNDGRQVSWWDVDSERELRPAQWLEDAVQPRSVALAGERTFLVREHTYTSPFAATQPHQMSRTPCSPFAPLGPLHIAEAAAVPDPTGRFLAVAANADPPPPFCSRLLVYDIDRDAIIIETHEGSGGAAPVWSANGRRVAFDSTADIFVLDVPARTLMRVIKTPRPNGGEPYCNVALSADGQTLAFGWVDDPGRLFFVSLPRLASPIEGVTTSLKRNPS